MPSSRLRILLPVLAVAAALAFVVALALQWRSAPADAGDPYADALPFRPRVTYTGPDVTVMNPGSEPYLDTQLTLFVGWTTCRASVGTVPPGEKVSIPLSAFTYDDGRRFDPATTKAKLLEVKARLSGQEVHRDLPPPQ